MDTVSAPAQNGEGFVDTLQRAGIAEAKKKVLHTTSDLEGGMRAVRELIQSGKEILSIGLWRRYYSGRCSESTFAGRLPDSGRRGCDRVQ